MPNKLTFDGRVLEERSSRPRIAHSDRSIVDFEFFARGVSIATNDYDGARPHVLFFAYDSLNAFVLKIRKRLCRVLQKFLLRTCIARRHRWWKIYEPIRVSRETAHY